MQHFNAYEIMWILVMFDLPTGTKKQRREAADFRKELLGDGFNMLQYSVYARPCPHAENAQLHIQRLKKWLPDIGSVNILTITDKQFGNMITFIHNKRQPPTRKPQYVQLSLF